MFRCWQQITHPFSFSEAIKEDIPILIDVEQGICNGSLGIFKNSIQQYIIFVYSFFFLKNTIKNLKLHLVNTIKNLTGNKCFNYENYNNVVVKHS